ncbi:MAG: hypothetical protein KIS76_14230 [Pyrinomonadaceae bacterium]|nr:hypothetical protein [Pyrinomonadaceae bacterium]
MLKKTLQILFSVIFLCGTVCIGQAQDRTSVGAKEVNGTFRSEFSGKFKGSANEIKIKALGGQKLRVSFDLVYPYELPNGELSANMGYADGVADIEADEAVFEFKSEYSDDVCSIGIKFVKPGEIKVSQFGSSSACGFGHRVAADGTYKKVSGKIPTFDEPEK